LRYPLSPAVAGRPGSRILATPGFQPLRHAELLRRVLGIQLRTLSRCDSCASLRCAAPCSSDRPSRSITSTSAIFPQTLVSVLPRRYTESSRPSRAASCEVGEQPHRLPHTPTVGSLRCNRPRPISCLSSCGVDARAVRVRRAWTRRLRPILTPEPVPPPSSATCRR
jgi:hypothetical protein